MACPQNGTAVLFGVQKRKLVLKGMNADTTTERLGDDTMVGALIRGAIVTRTYGTHKHLYISLFLLTIFGPIIDYGPP